MLAFITSHAVVFGLLFLAGICGVGILLVWIVEKSALAPLFASCTGVVAPYVAVLALLFGLFVVFLSGDLWSQRDRAKTAVAREADAIHILRSIADSVGERGKTLAGLVPAYGRTAISDDWRSAESQDAGETVSRKMLQECLFGGLAQTEPQIQRSAVDAVMEIRASRRDRLTAATSVTGPQKWVAALVLGFLTQGALVMVHLGKPRASALAMSLFSVGMAFILWITLTRLDPYLGPFAVSLQPISAASQGPS